MIVCSESKSHRFFQTNCNINCASLFIALYSVRAAYKLPSYMTLIISDKSLGFAH